MDNLQTVVPSTRANNTGNIVLNDSIGYVFRQSPAARIAGGVFDVSISNLSDSNPVLVSVLRDGAVTGNAATGMGTILRSALSLTHPIQPLSSLSLTVASEFDVVVVCQPGANATFSAMGSFDMSYGAGSLSITVA